MELFNEQSLPLSTMSVDFQAERDLEVAKVQPAVNHFLLSTKKETHIVSRGFSSI